MLIIAVILPWLSFLLRKKWYNAIVTFIFQILAIYTLFPTGIGVVIWLGISTWAVLAYHNSQLNKEQKKKKFSKR